MLPRKLSINDTHGQVPEFAEEKSLLRPKSAAAIVAKLLHEPTPVKPTDISIAEPDIVKPSLPEQTKTANDDVSNNGSNSDESANRIPMVDSDSEGELEDANDRSQDRPKPGLWSKFRDIVAYNIPFPRDMQIHISYLSLNQSSNDVLQVSLAAWKFPVTARFWTSLVSWWPLRTPIQECTEGETMVAWDCVSMLKPLHSFH